MARQTASVETALKGEPKFWLAFLRLLFRKLLLVLILPLPKLPSRVAYVLHINRPHIPEEAPPDDR